MKILFKNGHLICPAGGKDEVVDILIIGGVIEKIGPGISPSGDTETFDMTGIIVAPGFMDMHVHLREPGFEYKETIETGTAAAANGGFTSICCMPNTDPPIDNAAVVRWIREKSDAVDRRLVEVFPIGSVTKGREGKEIAPMFELTEAGAIAFSDDGDPVYDAEIMRRALEYSRMLNRPVIQHAEDNSLSRNGVMHEGFVSTLLGMQPIPSLAEEIIIARDIQLAEYTGAQYHAAHISTAGAVDLIRSAKNKKLRVSCEVAPHHFTLTDEAVRSFDTNTKMKPPLRSRTDIDAIRQGLKDGTIEVIASDHAPHTFDEKEVEFLYAPFGIIGLETAVGLALTELVEENIISLTEMIEKFSNNPRNILNLQPVNIAEGEKAELTFIRLSEEWVVDIHKFRSKSKNSPFHGKKLKGRPYGIFNRGSFFRSEL